MAFPNPIEAPNSFLDHLKAANLDFGTTVFAHYQSRPGPSSNGRLDDIPATEWCERMDTLLGKLSRVKTAAPEHQTALTALHDVCSRATVEVEEKLAMQKQSDAEAAKKREEEARLKAEQARLVAEQEERERLEKMAKLNAGRMEIEAAERELALKKQALRDALKVADEADVDEDEDDNEGSESTADQHVGTAKKSTKREVERETRRKLPQVTHGKPCQLCAQKNETKCAGPVGHACDVCWKQKKSCSNGGRHRNQDAAVKEEPKSPAQAGTRKRKAYSSVDANPIGTIEPIDVDFDIFSQPVGKRAKPSAATSSQQRFDGIVIPKPTRKSARTAKANSKKDGGVGELFRRLAQEHGAVARTYDEIADAMD